MPKHHDASTPEPTERPLSMLVMSGSIAKCPTMRMDVSHYRPDGTCLCLPPDDTGDATR